MPWTIVSESELVRPVKQPMGQWLPVDESELVTPVEEQSEPKAGWLERQWHRFLTEPQPWIKQIVEPKKRTSLKELFTPEYWKTTGKRAIEEAKEMIESIPQIASIASPIGMGQRLAAQVTEAIIPSGKPEEKFGLKSTKKIGEMAVDLATWMPKYLWQFYQDPVGTVRDRPLETITVLFPFLGKNLKAKLKGQELLTKQDLTLAFKEAAENLPEELSLFKAITNDPKFMTDELLSKYNAALKMGRERMLPPAAKFEVRPDGQVLIKESTRIKTPYQEAQKTTGVQPGELKGLNIKILTKEEVDKIEAMLAAKKKTAKSIGIPEDKLPPVVPPSEQPPVAPGAPEKLTGLIDRVNEALKAAKPLRGLQEEIYRAERAKRFAAGEKVMEKIEGEAGLEKVLQTQAGEMKKVAFESIRDNFTQEDLDELVKMITKNQNLNFGEKLTAINGFQKIFSERGGLVPTESELKVLEKVYGSEFVEKVLSKTPLAQSIRNVIVETLNVPRSVMASFDLSFGFRQGVFFVGRKRFWEAFSKQYKYFGSEKAYRELMESIMAHPDYPLLKKAGVAITEINAPIKAGLREEIMMGAPYAERIPIVGAGVRASARAYTGFANKLRADLAYDLIDKSRKLWNQRAASWINEMEAAKKAGNIKLMNKLQNERMKIDPDTSVYLLEKIGDFVNAGSGRGNFPIFKRSLEEINAVLFSPRLIASRLQLLNPMFYVKLPPVVRKEALKSLFTFLGAGATVLGTAKMAGLEVGTNPFSAGFGKIRIGDTFIDVWGGFQQYFRTAAQFAWGKTVSAQTGKVTKVGEGYKPLTRWDIAERFVTAKTAPVASFAVALMKGQNWAGEPIKISDELYQRVVPMVIQDMVDIWQEDPKLFPVGLLGIFGVGLQTYETRPPKYRW